MGVILNQFDHNTQDENWIDKEYWMKDSVKNLNDYAIQSD